MPNLSGKQKLAILMKTKDKSKEADLAETPNFKSVEAMSNFEAKKIAGPKFTKLKLKLKAK